MLNQGYPAASRMAYVYTGLGEMDQAVEWLEKAYEERSYSLAFLKANPMWDALRSHPRFQDLLRRLNFPH